jgi:superkiller protein 3
MSAVLKIQLKSAREAIERKAYQEAKDFSLSALECDDKNYNAWVFLGLAEQHLENYNESEKAYFKALQQNDVHPLAIQVRKESITH